MKECVLYYTAACPFCQKVLHFMKEHNISLISKDTRKDPQAREELIQIGGKPQVPCLVIDGQAMYESDAIISWLNTSY